MQLEQKIPTLGGLGEPPQRSRREQLAADGERARRDIEQVLSRARQRALGLAALRAGALLVAGSSVALLGAALVASVDGAALARGLAGTLGALAVGAVVWFCLRSPLQRAALGARDPRRLARLIGGPSDLLSSVELAREDPRGVSTELLSLLQVRAAESARKIDVERVLLAAARARCQRPDLGGRRLVRSALRLARRAAPLGGRERGAAGRAVADRRRSLRHLPLSGVHRPAASH